MLITITDLRNIDGATLKQWQKARFVLCRNNTMILSMSSEGACEALKTTAPADSRRPGGPTNPALPVAREPTLDELRAWFAWQTKHGRTNQRFVEAGLPYPAND